MKSGTERNVTCSVGLIYKTRILIRDGEGCGIFSTHFDVFVLLIQGKKVDVADHVIVRPVKDGIKSLNKLT